MNMQKETNLKYYLYEILIIFIGITVAFALNSWWEGIKTSKLEEKYLKGIKNDLSENISGLTGLIEIAEDNYNAIQKIIGMISQNNYQTDTIINNSVRMAYLFEFTPRATTFETMKASGNLNIISGYDLKNKIVEVHSYFSEIKKFDDLYRNYIYDYVIPYLWKNVDMISGRAINPGFVKQVEFKNILTGYMLFLTKQLDGYKNCLDKSKNLMELISND
jgi:hypothetical protein